jgi:O-antigen/teichoic acid export membrane protein
MFPAYSKLQNDKERLQTAFRKTIRLTFLVAIPASVGIILVSREFVLVVLGTEWSEMILAMQIIAIGGVFRAVVGTGGALFIAYGSPDWDFRMNAMRVLLIVLTIVPLSEQFGIAGAAVSITIGIGFTLPIWLYVSQTITDLSIVAYIEAIAIPLTAAIVMALPVVIINGDSILRLSLSVLVGIIVYSFSAHRLYRYRGWNPISELRKLAGS